MSLVESCVLLDCSQLPSSWRGGLERSVASWWLKVLKRPLWVGRRVCHAGYANNRANTWRVEGTINGVTSAGRRSE